MLSTLCMPPEYHTFDRDNQTLFFDPQNFIWFVTNPVGRIIVSEFGAGSNLEEITEKVIAHPGVDAEAQDIPAFIENYLSQLQQLGFLHHGEYQRTEWHSGVIASPVVLYIHLTSKCNLKCPYCYNQEHRLDLLKDKKEKEATVEDFLHLVDEAAELGIREVKLTGGEALLFKGALRIAEHARTRGMTVNLLTNATIMSKEIAAKISKVVDTVSISLDSARPELHDPVRGKGTHQRVLKSIAMLREAGVQRLHLNAVFTPVNKDYVEEFLEFAWDELKANNVTIAGEAIAVNDTLNKFGADQYKLTGEEYRQVSEQEKAFYQKRKSNHAAHPTHRANLRRTQCGVGNGILSVESNGDVYPCQTMHAPEHLCGNVFRDSLATVIAESETLQKMKSLVVDNLPECSKCPVRYICAGGCRQEAYSREGNLLARNKDMCHTFYENSVNRLWEAATLPAREVLETETARKERVGLVV